MFQIDSSRNERNDLKSNIDRLFAEVQDKNRKLNKIEPTLKDFEEKISSLNRENTLLNVEKSKIEAEMTKFDTIKNQMDEFESDKITLDQNIEILTNELKLKNEKITDGKKTMTKLVIENEEFRSKIG